jgi:NADH:ubiquinone oxidoreductase subunit 4 (subunit M)
MLFYTYQYFENKVHSNTVLKYIIIISVLVLLFFLIAKYLQNRISSKYRDLIIILILVIVLMLGINYSEYNQSKANSAQTSEMVSFIEKISNDKSVSVENILVNSTYLYDGMVIRLDRSYYQVNFDSGFKFYSLKNVELLISDIDIKEE